MPFISDNAWPAGLINIFNIARAQRTTFENRYYGPYDKLLNYCFGESFNFYVAPQNPPSNDSRDTVDFIVFLVVFDTNARPVLIVEVKDDGWAEKPGLRHNADEQMRSRYEQMLNECPLPRLWGLSLLGTSARVYCGDTTTSKVDPPFIAQPDRSVVLPRDHLAGQWSIDITSSDGFAKMKQIIADILAHVDNN